MIQVEGPDPTAVIRRARDHTEGTVPLILEAAPTAISMLPAKVISPVRLYATRRKR